MTDCDPASRRIRRDEGGLRSLIRADGRAVLIGAAATIAVQLGVFALVRRGGAKPTAAMLATLAISTVWVALASPAFAIADGSSVDYRHGKQT